MHISYKKKLERIYPACRNIIGSSIWGKIISSCSADLKPEVFSDTLLLHTGNHNIETFLPELALLEWTIYKITEGGSISSEVDCIVINPTVHLLQFSWRNLTSMIHKDKKKAFLKPEPGEEFVLVWRDPKTNKARTCSASDEDLLVLKIMVDGIKPENAAVTGNLPVGAVDDAIIRAVRKGILLSPKSRIRRDSGNFPKGKDIDESFFSSPVFTIQWHITQECDYHCKHCYDRSNISSLNLEQAVKILDDMRVFCRSRYVQGHVSFSGGNPLLYPEFTELYRAASERGFSIAILGNPAPGERIQELISIQRPTHFQVSLEGLKEHNDFIRGSGNFERVVEFLGVLRELKVYSMVMLTLTKDNIDQVLPLAEMLRGHADFFTFNRLSKVGEGMNLQLPSREDFMVLLKRYIKAAKGNPIMGLKDNLINILRRQNGIKPFGGCAGYGCGAAFNFITILPDGEAHACRKFPSPIGNVLKLGIAGVYESEMAGRYRTGSNACRSCSIRPVCGGCMAVVYSHNLDVFKKLDPYCFKKKSM
ncbi:MAG: thio(seleno)oxazole modification radical SAM maturase SbtM [Thermodesulfovibrionia bacterium]